jgi:hypothetical protein
MNRKPCSSSLIVQSTREATKMASIKTKGKMDQKLLSQQKHEQDYCKRMARAMLKKTEGLNLEGETSVSVSSLRRLCKYVSGKR